MLFHESKTSKATSLKDANFHPLANLFTVCWKRNAETCSPLQSAIGAWVTVYIDDASIDDWSSMLASSFLSKSTIEIDDPS